MATLCKVCGKDLSKQVMCYASTTDGALVCSIKCGRVDKPEDVSFYERYEKINTSDIGLKGERHETVL